MKDIAKFKYHILPGKCPADFQNISLHNEAYKYWKEFWDEFFKENHQPGEMRNRKDDFTRQDGITAITFEKQIVAMQLHTVFNIQSQAAREHSYINRSFNPEFFEKLQTRGIQSVMSFEWLTVDPAWRKTVTNFSFSQVIIALGLRLQKLWGVDAAIAISRNDVKVTQTAEALGFDVIMPHVSLHGKSCDLIAAFRETERTGLPTQLLGVVDFLWKTRDDGEGEKWNQKLIAS